MNLNFSKYLGLEEVSRTLELPSPRLPALVLPYHNLPGMPYSRKGNKTQASQHDTQWMGPGSDRRVSTGV